MEDDDELAPVKKKKYKAPRFTGRPTDYNEEYHCYHVTRLCMLGMTNRELADFFTVTEQTFQLWLRTHEEFSSAVHAGREGADADVAASMNKSAKGFTKKIRKTVVTRDGDIVNYDAEQYFPPDTRAQSNWLGNRQRKRGWGKSTDEQEAGVTHKLIIELAGGIPDAAGVRPQLPKPTVEGEAPAEPFNPDHLELDDPL